LDLDCSHVILLQGDEPLLLPRHLDQMSEAIKANANGNAWNATGPIENPEELDKHSFVKCSVSPEKKIMYCFRRSPGYSEFELQQKYIRKILGLIAFEKEFLLKLTSLPSSIVETYEFIEQMRIIENGFNFQSVSVSPSLPSVNEPSEANVVLDYIQNTDEQRSILKSIL
jgi:3-deoxy-manno-octulosonate cytidylyltransferase (CMP-KDO synthetase)